MAAAAQAARVEITGLFTFPGHSYSPAKARLAAFAEGGCLQAACENLRRAGSSFLLESPGFILSGGATPSVKDAESTILTEVRPGVYVFYDAQQLVFGHCRRSDIPNHVCLVLGLVDQVWVVDGEEGSADTAGQWWTVAARGKSS